MILDEARVIPFDDYDPFVEGMRSVLNRVGILSKLGTLDWKVGLVLQNGDETNFQQVVKSTESGHSVFQASPEWETLSKILSNNTNKEYVVKTYWLEMAKASGFLNSASSVWVIRADAKDISDDDSIFFQLTIVDNMGDGDAGKNKVLEELRNAGKHIMFVFSIEDYRALQSEGVIKRSNLRRRITPMAFIGDVNSKDKYSARPSIRGELPLHRAI